MTQLVSKVTEFIDANKLSSQAHLPTLCKLLSLMLSKVDWHEENGDYVCKLLHQFRGKVKFLRPANVNMIAKILHVYGEPVSLYYEVYERLCDIIATKQFQGNLPMVSCLSSVLRVNASAVPLKDIEEILENLINSHHLVDHINDVYQILRSVGIIKNELVDKFFLLSFEALLNEESSEVLRFASRYTNMHSPYTGNYYNRDFEEKVIEYLVGELEDNQYLHPIDFARRIGMLINFGHRLNDEMYNRLKNLLPRIALTGLLSISRGVEFQMKKKRRDLLNVSINPIPRDQKNPYYEWIEEVGMLIGKACEEKLLEDNKVKSSILENAIYLKNFSSSNEIYEEECFKIVTDKLIENVNNSKASIHLVGQICGALKSGNKCENPQLLDSLVNFFLARPDKNDFHTEAVRKFLTGCYDNGFRPNDEFLDIVCQGLVRDIDSLTGLQTLRLANILCSYDRISKTLVSALFSNEFMLKLDSEIEMASDRRHYPKMLRRALMELNRSVVLRYPEYGIPWFHSQYCVENRKSLSITRRSLEGKTLKEEVSEHLLALTGGWRFVKEDSYSEYFNNIDFEVHYDDRGHPVDLTSEHNDSKVVKKFAVQVLPHNAFTIDTKKLSGQFKSNSRELEIQGWNVINVNPFSWNSLQLTEKRAKTQYLEQTFAQAVVL